MEKTHEIVDNDIDGLYWLYQDGNLLSCSGLQLQVLVYEKSQILNQLAYMTTSLSVDFVYDSILDVKRYVIMF